MGLSADWWYLICHHMCQFSAILWLLLMLKSVHVLLSLVTFPCNRSKVLFLGDMLFIMG